MPSLYHLTKVFYLPNHVVQENLTVGHAEPVPPNHGVLLTNSCSAVLNTWLSDMPSLYHLTKVFYLPNHVVQEYLTVGHAEPVHLTKVFYLPIHVVQEYLTVGHAEPVPPNQGVLLTNSCSTWLSDMPNLYHLTYLPIHVVQEYLTVGHAEPVPPNQGVLLTNSCSTGIPDCGHAEPVPPNQGVLLTNSCSTGIPDCRTCRTCTLTKVF